MKRTDIERRNSDRPTRRAHDHVCVLHDEIRKSDLACFGVIKKDLGDLEIKLDNLV